MTEPAPTFAAVAAAAARFAAYGPDRSWDRLLDATAPAVDLARAEHRAALLRWLNAWGCRIGYPRPGEPDAFGAGVAAWWAAWHPRLPAGALSVLSDAECAVAGEGYAALAAVPVSAGPRVRTLGATAATKALYALRPHTFLPWDAAIARRMHGARDAAAYARHLRTGREWARALLREAGAGGAGVDEAALPGLLGRPGRSLAKVLDEYCYVTYTRGG